MQSELKRIQEEVKITFLYVTHDQEEALTMSDRIAIFNQGRIVQIGSPTEVYEEPADEFVAGFVGTSNILKRDGRRFVLRPEKVRVSPLGQLFDEAGLHTEEGIVIEAVYVGTFTRYAVGLADGTRIVAIRQNFDRTTARFREEQGSRVQVAWRPDNLFELQ